MNETVDPARIREVQPTAQPPRKRRWLAPIVIALAALLAFAGYERLAPGTLKEAAPTGPPPQTVRAVAVARGPMPITLEALGAVTPLASVTIRTQISGRLMNIGFSEGQTVKAGDFLAQIDPRPYQAALAQSESQLAKDTALLGQAQADLVRYQTLNKQDSIAKQQVDDQAFLVAQYKAAIAADQAQIDAAKLNLGYTRITSPIAGRVGLRLVDVGNYVQPSDTSGLVVVIQLDPISVVFSVPEDNLPRISERLASAGKLPVTVFDRSNVKQLAVGELSTFDNQIDTTTGTVKLRASFANPDNALFPNQFVNVRLLVDTVANAVLAPNAALQLGQKGPFVYVLKDGKSVEVRQVKTGPSDAKQTVIESGLEAGESVVTDGVDRLRDGAEVRLADAPRDETPRKRRRDKGQGATP